MGEVPRTQLWSVCVPLSFGTLKKETQNWLTQLKNWRILPRALSPSSLTLEQRLCHGTLSFQKSGTHASCFWDYLRWFGGEVQKSKIYYSNTNGPCSGTVWYFQVISHPALFRGRSLAPLKILVLYGNTTFPTLKFWDSSPSFSRLFFVFVYKGARFFSVEHLGIPWDYIYVNTPKLPWEEVGQKSR